MTNPSQVEELIERLMNTSIKAGGGLKVIDRIMRHEDARKAAFKELSAALSSLLSEREAMELDARRYWWLRSSESAVAEICNSALPKADGFVFMEGEQLDAAIDAALAAEKEQPHERADS